MIWYRPRGVWVGALGAVLITVGLQLSSNDVATFEYSSARAMLGGSVRAGLPFVPWIVLGWSHAQSPTGAPAWFSCAAFFH